MTFFCFLCLHATRLLSSLTTLVFTEMTGMFNLIEGNAGAHISVASSCDDKHPPENIIDGNPETFWCTTGMFPQEFIVKFNGVMGLTNMALSTFNVKKLTIETTESDTPEKFDVLATRELEPTDHQLQTEEFPLKDHRAQCIRFIIESGYDHFVAVYSLRTEGRGLHG